MSDSFSAFAEDVLLEGSRMQRANADSYSVSLLDVVATIRSNPESSWIAEVIPYMVNEGWVSDESTHDGFAFRVLGFGYSISDGIIDSRKSKTLVGRIKGVPRSDWIALGALIVSAFALFGD